jgi:hypothetical protein
MRTNDFRDRLGSLKFALASLKERADLHFERFSTPSELDEQQITLLEIEINRLEKRFAKIGV